MSNSVSPTITARSAAAAGLGERGEQHRGMRLRGVVVGGLGGDEEAPEAVGGEDVVEPAPRLAGGDPEQRAGVGRQPLERGARAGIERRLGGVAARAAATKQAR